VHQVCKSVIETPIDTTDSAKPSAGRASGSWLLVDMRLASGGHGAGAPSVEGDDGPTFLAIALGRCIRCYLVTWGA